MRGPQSNDPHRCTSRCCWWVQVRTAWTLMGACTFRRGARRTGGSLRCARVMPWCTNRTSYTAWTCCGECKSLCVAAAGEGGGSSCACASAGAPGGRSYSGSRTPAMRLRATGACFCKRTVCVCSSSRCDSVCACVCVRVCACVCVCVWRFVIVHMCACALVVFFDGFSAELWWHGRACVRVSHARASHHSGRT
jgi:hypothetical protein